MQWIENKQNVMVKHIIVAATFLLIYDISEVIQCTQAILDLIILV